MQATSVALPSPHTPLRKLMANGRWAAKSKLYRLLPVSGPVAYGPDHGTFVSDIGPDAGCLGLFVSW